MIKEVHSVNWRASATYHPRVSSYDRTGGNDDACVAQHRLFLPTFPAQA